jgi:hypothetical protein
LLSFSIQFLLFRLITTTANGHAAPRPDAKNFAPPAGGRAGCDPSLRFRMTIWADQTRAARHTSKYQQWSAAPLFISPFLESSRSAYRRRGIFLQFVLLISNFTSSHRPPARPNNPARGAAQSVMVNRAVLNFPFF